jgi:hypothetical protein
MDVAFEFLVAGSPRTISRAIEDCAVEQRMVSALVVPWESDDATLSMSVTSARVDGWAIEHVNLGTIRLTDAGDGRTRVAVTLAGMAAADASAADRPTRLLENFARQLQRRFKAAS